MAPAKGLPRCGSLSTVLANLVLHEADDAVLRTQCGNLFYARYCDDVVIAHPDESVCRAALEAYKAALPLQGKAVQLLRFPGEGRAAYQPSRDALRRAGQHGLSATDNVVLF